MSHVVGMIVGLLLVKNISHVLNHKNLDYKYSFLGRNGRLRLPSTISAEMAK